ncbi:MAG: MBL fold metallo-hydrolase, partial [Terriglobales bacterium]
MKLDGIKITWLGHATFRIETPQGKTVLIDPWVAGNPKCPEKEKNFAKLDVMLCTHGHGDHIGDAVDIARKYDPIVIGMPELCGWLASKGIKRVSG